MNACTPFRRIYFHSLCYELQIKPQQINLVKNKNKDFLKRDIFDGACTFFLVLISDKRGLHGENLK